MQVGRPHHRVEHPGRPFLQLNANVAALWLQPPTAAVEPQLAGAPCRRRRGAFGALPPTCSLPLWPMQIHFEAKHPKLPWEPEKVEDVHAQAGGVTTQGIAVRGSTKKK